MNLKILVVHQGERSFVRTDIELLSQISVVTAFNNYPPSLSRTGKLIAAVQSSDLVWIWFLGRHSVFPLLWAKLLGKKTVLIAGGWDVASCPEIHYGLMRPGILSAFLKPLFLLPDRIASISQANRKDLLEHTPADKKKCSVIYLGFRDVQPPSDYGKKERMVITVGDVNRSNLKRKGLENFLAAAAALPSVPFVVIGRCADDEAVSEARGAAPPNVTFTGEASAEELRRYFTRAAVYAQFSYHEAFGSAVAEAMLYGCVPVVTRRFALPEVVGEAGYCVEWGNVPAAAKAIEAALADDEKRLLARARILEKFPLENRRKGIEDLLCRLT